MPRILRLYAAPPVGNKLPLAFVYVPDNFNLTLEWDNYVTKLVRVVFPKNVAPSPRAAALLLDKTLELPLLDAKQRNVPSLFVRYLTSLPDVRLLDIDTAFPAACIEQLPQYSAFMAGLPVRI